MCAAGKRRLGDVLREHRHINEDTLASALEEQQRSAARLGEVLLQHGMVSKDDLVLALQEVTHFRYVDARAVTVAPEVLGLVPRGKAESLCVLPLAMEGKRLAVIMAEPQNLHQLDDLRFMAAMEITPRMGFRAEIEEGIAHCYGQAVQTPSPPPVEAAVSFLDSVDTSAMQFITTGSSERNKAAMEEFEAELRQEKTPAVHLFSAIIAAAAGKKASDIHIEPQPSGTLVRLRVDGVLRELTTVPSEHASSLVSRIKILADMDIAERRAPQDGRLLVRIGDHQIDIRVSTLPTHCGEKVVMRLLDPSASRVGFEKLGLAQDKAEALTKVIKMPQGMLLVTGPTGSGKSTTLYAALNAVRSPSVNIITVEDPVEYRIDEINQVQVNPKAGLTFAGCLRSMLRQDPNVIMVGEIRDQETAEIALQAAQTGHLVLSTLHTNDSVSAITRLLDLGVPAFLIAASVTAVIAQRLVRKLCSCRVEVPMSDDVATRLLGAGVSVVPAQAYVAAGCSVCDDTGYKGRLGIYELLLMDDALRSAVRSGARDDEIRNLARSAGMRLMQEDALEKIREGTTTLDEVLRVVPFEAADDVHCRECGQPMAAAFLFCPYCGTPARPGVARAPEPRKRHLPRGATA